MRRLNSRAVHQDFEALEAAIIGGNTPQIARCWNSLKALGVTDRELNAFIDAFGIARKKP